MADLRESGAIEQDTDIIIFPYREKHEDKYSNDGLFIIAKHRNGAIGEVSFRTCESMVELTDPFDIDKTVIIPDEPVLKDFYEVDKDENDLPF